MNTLAIELDEDETRNFDGAGFEYRKIAGSNFDGNLMSTVLVSLTSAATIKALMPLLLEIVKKRRSGSIKINGMEIKNVSESVILEALKAGAPRKQ
jgi:hypothetical protein